MQIIEQFYYILEEVSIADLFPIISLSMSYFSRMIWSRRTSLSPESSTFQY